jgi:hypothetical protein
MALTPSDIRTYYPACLAVNAAGEAARDGKWRQCVDAYNALQERVSQKWQEWGKYFHDALPRRVGLLLGAARLLVPYGQGRREAVQAGDWRRARGCGVSRHVRVDQR